MMIGISACTQSTSQNMEANCYPIVEYSYDVSMDTIEDVIQHSTNIVKATLTSIEAFDGFVNTYFFKVDTDYTGNTADEIHVYDAYNDNYEIGHSYYLFLYGRESVLYPHTVYTTVKKDLIIDTESVQPTLIPNDSISTFNPELTEAEIVDAIRVGSVGREAEESVSVSISSSISSISDEADVIAEIKISNEFPNNKYVSTYTVEQVSILKGPVGAIASVMSLPPCLDSNLTYYIFLKENPAYMGEYCLFSRIYPVMEATELNLSQISLCEDEVVDNNDTPTA